MAEHNFRITPQITLDNLPDQFQSAADSLSRAPTATLKAILAAWLAGKATTPEFVSDLTKTIGGYVASALQIADLYAASLLGRDPVGLGINADDLDRWTKASETIADTFDQEGEPLPRMERLVIGEAVNALQQGMRQAYEQHGVKGYVRGTDADPCELCTWLRKEHLRPGGFIYPIDQPMHKHPGCCCFPIPHGTTELPEFHGAGATEGEDE